MTSYGQSGARLPGARREKVRGYLRAANEMRQIYQDQLSQKLQSSESDGSMPGDYPDVDIVRSGNEEMLLFPSYATKHTTRRTNPGGAARHQPGTNESIESPHSSGDADYWKREWEKYEDINAVVDVDVRGWIYTPQQGPLNRKNRLLLAVARRLSGVYAPTSSPTVSRSSSQAPTDRERLEDNPSKQEDELAAREAENIARRGEIEADAAVRGSYSQADPRRIGSDSPGGSRSGSPARTNTMRNESEEFDASLTSLKKRQSWNEPANMTREEMSAANELLMARLKPFMTMPMAQTPITIFLFNDQKSTSKTVTTDDSGHFNLRAALDFTPTQVRVLASEKLSATEDVIITGSSGVSLISDIDDTIKHSAIASGAREIFKNTFIRELGDLTIHGVKEWYTKLSSLGVNLHYVSNSPWQLYPLLRSYFALAGLPHGSFHLKQYSGMLQGIFEPAAERKRGSLDRIMNDFPERKFILVGDSGEADLEVYTDVVLEHPKRILGVFIRDVTTPIKKGFFDHSLSNATQERKNLKDANGVGDSPHDTDTPGKRPSLPARPKTEHRETPSPEEDLIDFGDDLDTTTSEKVSHANDMRQLKHHGKPGAPAKPDKPSSLRNFSTHSLPPTNHERLSTSDTETHEAIKKRPPPPPKPRRSGASSTEKLSDTTLPPSSRAPFSSTRQNQYQPPSEPTSTRSGKQPSISRSNTSTSTSSSQQSRNEEGYAASARRQLASAYNALPAIRSADQTGISNDNRPVPPGPPRRGLSSYPAAAARWATGATGGDPAAGGDGGLPGGSYDKKLELWRRRWARSEEIMQQRGVVLRSWRVGSDVMDECVKLVQKELSGNGKRSERLTK